ncbi:hypothetical protein [Pajaroellobacter abortibovis]|uniref:hypothetical protein n=1 Tax=Pajaroellobacter abortibovis TaxID=1882918 RepID=UPI0012EC3B64|nr:hypothetical protein [Pajaroellobacter abortibovis]
MNWVQQTSWSSTSVLDALPLSTKHLSTKQAIEAVAPLAFYGEDAPLARLQWSSF